MGILIGFAPWIVYWALVGNVPFTAAVLVALATAAASTVIGRLKRTPEKTFEIGSCAAFVVLTILVLTLSQAFLEQWLLPLSSAAILIAVLIGALIGKPFVREFAAAEAPADVASTDVFDRITASVTWIWVAVFGGMTISSLIPPLAQSDASMLDSSAPLSVVCYWVIPFSLLALAVLVSRFQLEGMSAEAEEAPRKTTFVAYDEATIDELYYLAQEHAKREVGSGKEPYDVRVGGTGTPLVGDDSRNSWTSTYKVRERKR